MGTDISGVVQQQQPDGTWLDVFDIGEFSEDNPLGFRAYNYFGLIADVRNYAQIPPIADPRGRPKDFHGYSYEDGPERYGFTWYELDELLNFDWDRAVEDRRDDGAGTVPPTQGRMTTYRAEMGEPRLAQLRRLREQYPGRVRLIFCFDC